VYLYAIQATNERTSAHDIGLLGMHERDTARRDEEVRLKPDPQRKIKREGGAGTGVASAEF
jgi:hypothetical protein